MSRGMERTTSANASELSHSESTASEDVVHPFFERDFAFVLGHLRAEIRLREVKFAESVKGCH